MIATKSINFSKTFVSEFESFNTIRVVVDLNFDQLLFSERVDLFNLPITTILVSLATIFKAKFKTAYGTFCLVVNLAETHLR